MDRLKTLSPRKKHKKPTNKRVIKAFNRLLNDPSNTKITQSKELIQRNFLQKSDLALSKVSDEKELIEALCQVKIKVFNSIKDEIVISKKVGGKEILIGECVETHFNIFLNSGLLKYAIRLPTKESVDLLTRIAKIKAQIQQKKVWLPEPRTSESTPILPEQLPLPNLPIVRPTQSLTPPKLPPKKTKSKTNLLSHSTPLQEELTPLSAPILIQAPPSLPPLPVLELATETTEAQSSAPPATHTRSSSLSKKAQIAKQVFTLKPP